MSKFLFGQQSIVGWLMLALVARTCGYAQLPPQHQHPVRTSYVTTFECCPNQWQLDKLDTQSVFLCGQVNEIVITVIFAQFYFTFPIPFNGKCKII